MSSKLYLLYYLFNINYELTKSKKMSYVEITALYKPFLLFFKNNNKHEKDFINKYIFDIMNIISNIIIFKEMFKISEKCFYYKIYFL